MGKLRTTFLLFVSLTFFSAVRLNSQPPLVAAFNYIDSYSDLAVEQMMMFRIPASVILAQAIFESGSGTSMLARKSNNHFGIKCHLQWDGDTAVKTDDAENECFRRYNSIKESYEDHSKFLVSRKRYSHLFDLPLTDYRSWCYGIKRSGYATYPKYAEELIRIIEQYELYRLDRPAVLHSVSISPKLPQIKKSPFDPSAASLALFAQHGMLWMDEKEIHIRSLDMVVEAPFEEDILVAGN